MGSEDSGMTSCCGEESWVGAGTDRSKRRCGPPNTLCSRGLLFKVNNQKVSVPYNPNEHLRVILRAQRLLLATDFEMVLDFDGKHSAGNRQGRQQQKALSVPGVLAPTCNPSHQERKQDSFPCYPGLIACLKETNQTRAKKEQTVQGAVEHI